MRHKGIVQTSLLGIKGTLYSQLSRCCVETIQTGSEMWPK